MDTQNRQELTPTVFAELKEAIKASRDGMIRAGEIVVQCLDAGLSLAVIADSCNDRLITVGCLQLFEKIGRGTMIPELMSAAWTAAPRVSKLPPALQRKVIEAPVELMVVNSGKTDVLMVNVEDLTRTQAAQVFSSDGVRSVAAQRAYYESERARVAPADIAKSRPYTIRNGKVQFTGPCEMTRREMATILAELA